jgi:hypothetical protein
LESLKEAKINGPLIEYLNFEWGLRFLNSLQQIICKYLENFVAKVLYKGRQTFEVNEGTVSSDILKSCSI